MGLSNRDYAREHPSGGYGYQSGPQQWSAVTILIVINVVVFILQNAVHGLTEKLSLSGPHIYRNFEVWRLITHAFCHSTSGIGHILFNMWGLYLFGRMIEPVLGRREFLAFYFVGLLLSAAAYLGLQAFTQEMVPAVGASGAVMAVMLLTARIYPYRKILVMFFLPVELRVMAVLWVLVDVLGLVRGGTNIGHMAHLGGAVWGFAYHYFKLRVLGGWWSNLTEKFKRKPSSPKHVKLYEPPEQSSPAQSTPVPNDEQVDAILDKIHREGEASLTEREREILKEASTRYRKN